MTTLDTILWLAELFLVPASLVWLISAWRRPTGSGFRAAPTMLALALALTVAQPFGVVGTKREGAPRPPEYAGNGHSVHVARAFGVPVLPFRLYSRSFFWSGENAPTATLRARSWLWLPILTNASKIAETCSIDVFTPCWDPEPGEGQSQNDLTVFREGGKQWATIDNPAGKGNDTGANRIPDSFTWELKAGIASPAGLAYWVLAGFLVIAAHRRTRPSNA